MEPSAMTNANSDDGAPQQWCDTPAPFFPQGLHVLLVEDDAADAYLIYRTLVENPRVGEIVHARDGVEALQLLDSGAVDPDLAIIDLNMPRKNGFSLLVELASRERPHFATVVLTSSKSNSDAVRSKLRGANRFLTKPDTIEELDLALSNVIAAL
jgi:CheY-like chemotaxis protein